MPHSNQIFPVNHKVTPEQREIFFRVENNKGWPTDDPVSISEKHRDAEVERLGPGRYKVTWGDRPIPEPLWLTIQVGSYGRERATVRLTPVDAEGNPLTGKPVEVEADSGTPAA
jgi:hypothetical protein